MLWPGVCLTLKLYYQERENKREVDYSAILNLLIYFVFNVLQWITDEWYTRILGLPNFKDLLFKRDHIIIFHITSFVSFLLSHS